MCDSMRDAYPVRRQGCRQAGPRLHRTRERRPPAGQPKLVTHARRPPAGRPKLSPVKLVTHARRPPASSPPAGRRASPRHASRATPPCAHRAVYELLVAGATGDFEDGRVWRRVKRGGRGGSGAGGRGGGGGGEEAEGRAEGGKGAGERTGRRAGTAPTPRLARLPPATHREPSPRDGTTRHATQSESQTEIRAGKPDLGGRDGESRHARRCRRRCAARVVVTATVRAR